MLRLQHGYVEARRWLCLTLNMAELKIGESAGENRVFWVVLLGRVVRVLVVCGFVWCSGCWMGFGPFQIQGTDVIP